MDYLQLKRWVVLLVVCVFVISRPLSAQRVRVGSADVPYVAPTDTTITTSDVVTNNASPSKHGWLAKTSGNAYDFLLGSNAFGHTLPFGTITSNTPFVVSQTWNAAGVTFYGHQIAITKTAAQNGSRLLSMTVGGAEVAYVDGGANVGRVYGASMETPNLFLSNSTFAGSEVIWPAAKITSCAGSNNLAFITNAETAGVGLDFNTVNTLTAKSFNCGAGGHIAAQSVRGTASTVASLPTGVEGMLVAVTDSTTAVPGAVIAGSGSNHVLAFYNGTSWVVQGGTLGVQTTTATGTQNDFALTAGTRVLRCNNATLLTLNGLTPGVDGQLLDIVSVGAGEVDLTPQAAGSTAAYRLIPYATVGQTPLAPASGTATLVYDGTTARWRLIAHEQGAWITPPFNAANFSAPTGTWVVLGVQVNDYRYRLVGRTLHLEFFVGATNITGTPANLLLTLPNGHNPAPFNNSIGAIWTQSNGGAFTGGGTYSPGTGATINLYTTVAQTGNWAASAGNAAVLGSFTIEVK
jgi:hypothetical protein